MKDTLWLGVLALVAAAPASAGIIKGVMSVTGAEMDWWGGLVRDTIARQLDVDKSSMKYVVEPGAGRYRDGTITFAAKTGQSIDLQKLHQDLKATRLGKGTKSAVHYLQITAEGDVSAGDKETLLKVSGTGQQFILVDDPKAKPKEGTAPAHKRLQDALAKGEKITSVTGRVQGWNGNWPVVLRELPDDAKKPLRLVVTDFETMKK